MIVTDDMVAEALDAKATMSQLHMYLYSTEKCRCGEEWTDSHWMRFILERAISVAEEPEWEYGQSEVLTDGTVAFGSPVETLEEAIHRRDIDRINYPWPEELGVGRRRKAGPWKPVEN